MHQKCSNNLKYQPRAMFIVSVWPSWRSVLLISFSVRKLNAVQLLTHEAPFANMKKTHQVISRKREAGLPDRPRDKRVIDRGLDEKMWNLLCQCWSKDPKSRIKVERLVKKLHERGISPVWGLYLEINLSLIISTKSHDPKKPSHLLWLTQLKAEVRSLRGIDTRD